MSNDGSLAIVAGETSGDLIAAPVLKALREKVNDLNAFGIGGPAMQSQGLEALWTIDALSVRGYSEVLGSLPRLLSLRRSLGNEIITRRPAAFVGVDAPLAWLRHSNLALYRSVSLGLAPLASQKNRAKCRSHVAGISVRKGDL